MKSLIKVLLLCIPIFLQACGEDKKAKAEAEAMLCDMQKGNVISKCLNMQVGAVGMANCNEAIQNANFVCKRTDLTIMNILEEAKARSAK